MVNKNLEIEKKKVFTVKYDTEKISCISGRAWITYEYGNDIILSCGNSIETAKYRKIVIEALEDSSFNIFYRKKYKNMLQFFFGKFSNSNGISDKKIVTG